MLRTGAIILTLWAGLNLLLAVAILVAISLFGQNAPALSILLNESEIRQLDAKVLATFNSMAVMLNAGIAASCILSLFVIWTSLIQKSRWAFWALLISIGLLHLFGFVSISFIGGSYLLATIVSTAIVAIGFGLCGYAVLLRRC